MLDFNHVLSTPGADVQYFFGGSGSVATLTQWQTWRKPRGVKFIYLIGVGGGASGMASINTGTTSGGGAGGNSGAQTVVMIPAMMIPDTLYINCGAGGFGSTISGALGNGGIQTCVTIEPNPAIPPNMTLLLATGGTLGGTIPTITTGGTAGAAAAVSTIANMPLASRGFFNSFAGQQGSTGGSSTTAGIALTLPTTGLMVTGGTGGGGSNNTTAFAGGSINSVGALGQDFYPVISGGNSAVTSTPATAGSSHIARNFIMNYGGTGGGGATTTAGGVAGAGAQGSPGCGGGGAGGGNTTNTTLKAGDGGVGFVYIISV